MRDSSTKKTKVKNIIKQPPFSLRVFPFSHCNSFIPSFPFVPPCLSINFSHSSARKPEKFVARWLMIDAHAPFDAHILIEAMNYPFEIINTF